jgi:hypothetical protein
MLFGSSVPSYTTSACWVLHRRLLAHAERCSWWVTDIYCADKNFNDIMALDAVQKLGILYAH